jgi:hypothetical protein
MKLYSERYKDIERFQLWTYAEVKIVENGYTESDDQNTITILQSRKWGFVEVEELEKPESIKEIQKEIREETWEETWEESATEATTEEIPEEPTTEATIEKIPEEPATEAITEKIPKEKVKKGRSAKKEKVATSKKAKNSALGMDDVDALTGGRH